MPQSPHTERHFQAPAVVRDIVIGMADGLTVPFALAAGLAGAIDSGHVILTAGLAEIAAGSIAMGLGGYLAARTDMEHFRSERAREERETDEIPEVEAEEVADVFRKYGLEEPGIQVIVKSLQKDRTKFVDFMMKFELGIDAPDPKRAITSALTIGTAYAVGGAIPLLPYALIEGGDALRLSVILTSAALFVFGYVKGLFTARPWRSALSTLAVGAIAAGAAYALARAIS
ncbi:MAG: VIT1/CCC1 transporter family protein [Deltaproteobacteria bacterium]|nr:VIT1/CCC1 transporter family protein [Deltaproteobacteria bacterium]MBI3294641.1 VIT1/CCC1 transporter family protein [Deltaproteobacteria bacterium]